MSPMEKSANKISRKKQGTAHHCRGETERYFFFSDRHVILFPRKSVLFSSISKRKCKGAVIHNSGMGNSRSNGCHGKPKDSGVLKGLCFRTVRRVGDSLAVHNGKITGTGKNRCALQLRHRSIQRRRNALPYQQIVNIQHGIGTVALSSHNTIKANTADLPPTEGRSHRTHKRKLYAKIVPAVLCNRQCYFVPVLMLSILFTVKHEAKRTARTAYGKNGKSQITIRRQIPCRTGKTNLRMFRKMPCRRHMRTFFMM